MLSPTLNSPRSTPRWGGVGDLEWQEVRCDAGDVLGNPGLEGGVGLIRVILFNQPLDRLACIDYDGPAHAHYLLALQDLAE